MFVLAWSAIGPLANAQRYFPEAEVVAELVPFCVGGFAVFFTRSPGAALVDELPVVADHFFRIDRDVALRGVQIEVSQHFRGDVDRQTTVDSLGGKDASEVVWGERQRCAINIGEVCPPGKVGKEFADPARWEDLQVVVGAALEQMRQRRPEETFVGVVTLE